MTADQGWVDIPLPFDVPAPLETIHRAEAQKALAINWLTYRACPVCKAETGQACRSLSGSVVDGRPDGVITVLTAAHTSRKLRVQRRARCGCLSPGLNGHACGR